VCVDVQFPSNATCTPTSIIFQKIQNFHMPTSMNEDQSSYVIAVVLYLYGTVTTYSIEIIHFGTVKVGIGKTKVGTCNGCDVLTRFSTAYTVLCTAKYSPFALAVCLLHLCGPPPVQISIQLKPQSNGQRTQPCEPSYAIAEHIHS
jgi:hypothetical protein